MRSKDVDQVLSKMTRMFPWILGIKSMPFGCSKTVSKILNGCLIASGKINSLSDFQDFVGRLWIHPQAQKMLIFSEAMRHHLRIFDTGLEHPKGILLIPKIHGNILVILGNT